MAKDKSNKKNKAAEAEEENVAKDYSGYADKAPTPSQEHFADWIIEKCGLEFATAKEEKAFRNGVRLGKALVLEHQKSEENKEFKENLATEKAEAKASADEEKAAAKKAAKKSGKKPAAKEAETDEPEGDEDGDADEGDGSEDEPEAEETPKPKPAKKAPAKKAAAKKAGAKATAAPF